jgi:hypothetical protein
MNASATWLDYLTAFGAVTTPLLVLALTAVGWRLRQRIERQHELEDKLREDRIQTYNVMLEPFIIMLTPDMAWASDPKNKNKDKNRLGMQKMLGQEYRKAAFKMSLVAPDAVVRAYNDLMQYSYEKPDLEPKESETERVRAMIELLGTFLLEIRKSMGNQATELDAWDMLDWMMNDARALRSGGKIA